LKWDISNSEIQSIKASQPKLKLNIIAHGDKGSQTESQVCGNVLIDMRDLMREIKQQTYKVNNMPGAEIVLSAKINTTLHVGPGNRPLGLTNSDVSIGKSADTKNNVLTVLTVGLLAYRNLTNICTDNKSYWFTFSLFNKEFHTEEFKGASGGPKPVKDIIKIECPLDTYVNNLKQQFPLKIFLSTQEKIVAKAEIIFPFDIDSSSVFPIDSTQWYHLLSNALDAVPPEISVSLNIDVSNTQSSDVVENDTEVYEEAEDDDLHGSKKSVHFESSSTSGIDDAVDAPVASEVAEEAVETAVDDNRAGVDSNDEQLRHYRISVDVRSIGGFKRAAHVGVHYVYPYLGSATAVRTHPSWVTANVESKIDNASATYECCMSSRNLREVFTAHPFKCTILSRSQMGNTTLGDCSVDFSLAMNASPHSFRCPLTSRTFTTLNEYTKHRQTMIALRAAGRLERAPPVEPVTIRAIDTNVGIVANNTANMDIVSGAKVRVVVIIEDIGSVGPEVAVPVKQGYKMHGGGVYEVQSEVEFDDTVTFNNPRNSFTDGPMDPLDREDLTQYQRAQLEALRIDWEGWRRNQEIQWKDALREKEQLLRKKIEYECQTQLAARADDLKRAHEEAGRLEVRLRQGIEQVERQKNAWTLKEEQSAMKIAQKTAELQLLQRRVKDEAKLRVDAEVQRVDVLANQNKILVENIERLEKRLKETEKEFDSYRQHARATPESLLREEIAKLKAVVGEAHAEIERERRCKSDMELEKEHYRSQMHRLAIALKREREKSNVLARQELEQLRLEFLAREERYVLDGDREELRNIRHELANLRTYAIGSTSPLSTSKTPVPSNIAVTDNIAPVPSVAVINEQSSNSIITDLRQQLNDFLLSGNYTDDDQLIVELKKQIVQAEYEKGIADRVSM